MGKTKQTLLTWEGSLEYLGEAGHVTRSSAQVSQEETLSGKPSGSGSERRVGSGPERTWIFCHTQHPAALHPLLPRTLSAW